MSEEIKVKRYQMREGSAPDGVRECISELGHGLEKHGLELVAAQYTGGEDSSWLLLQMVPKSQSPGAS